MPEKQPEKPDEDKTLQMRSPDELAAYGRGTDLLTSNPDTVAEPAQVPERSGPEQTGRPNIIGRLKDHLQDIRTSRMQAAEIRAVGLAYRHNDTYYKDSDAAVRKNPNTAKPVYTKKGRRQAKSEINSQQRKGEISAAEARQSKIRLAAAPRDLGEAGAKRMRITSDVAAIRKTTNRIETDKQNKSEESRRTQADVEKEQARLHEEKRTEAIQEVIGRHALDRQFKRVEKEAAERQAAQEAVEREIERKRLQVIAEAAQKLRDEVKAREAAENRRRQADAQQAKDNKHRAEAEAAAERQQKLADALIRIAEEQAAARETAANVADALNNLAATQTPKPQDPKSKKDSAESKQSQEPLQKVQIIVDPTNLGGEIINAEIVDD